MPGRKGKQQPTRQHLTAQRATRRDLQNLAYLRLHEAEALFEKGLYDGCAYLCGYVVEMALKARICATLDLEDYPEKDVLRAGFHTHDFDDLLLLAGMQGELSRAGEALHANWSIGTSWTPERRYDPQGTVDRQQAQAILDAVRNEQDGVLAWISSRW